MISDRDRTHIERAFAIASSSTERQRHGAVIVKSGRVLSVGVNTFRNHPQTVSDPNTQSSYHAEHMAIKATSTDITGATMYVARINRNGKGALSAPCKHCYQKLVEAGIKRAVWSGDNNTIMEMMI